MKSIEYYCSSYFDPIDAKEMLATKFLNEKIEAGYKTINDLLEVHYMERDGRRINRIMKAISDWKVQLNEIYGNEMEME